MARKQGQIPITELGSTITLDREIFQASIEASEMVGELNHPNTNVGHREDLLRKLERDYFPRLQGYFHLPEIRRMVKIYNERVEKSAYPSDHEPINLEGDN